jgi:hypothetical protein
VAGSTGRTSQLAGAGGVRGGRGGGAAVTAAAAGGGGPAGRVGRGARRRRDSVPKLSAKKSSPFDGGLTRAAVVRVTGASRSRRLRPGCWLTRMRRWGGGRAANSAPPCPVAVPGPRAAYL